MIKHALITTKTNQDQSGVAAIEFALSLMVFFLIFFGLIAFGALFWAQQKLSYAAGEGSRAIFQEFIDHKKQQDISPKICEHSLEATGFLKPDTSCVVGIKNCTSPGGADSPLEQCQAYVKLSYNTKNNSLIHSVNWIGAAFSGDNPDTAWMPGRLAAQSTVNIHRFKLTP